MKFFVMLNEMKHLANREARFFVALKMTKKVKKFIEKKTKETIKIYLKSVTEPFRSMYSPLEVL